MAHEDQTAMCRKQHTTYTINTVPYNQPSVIGSKHTERSTFKSWAIYQQESLLASDTKDSNNDNYFCEPE